MAQDPYLDDLLASLDPSYQQQAQGLRIPMATDLAPKDPDVPMSVPPPIAKTQAQAPTPAQALVPAQQAVSAQPDVQQYIKQKFNLGDYSDENRKKLVDETNKYDVGSHISAALAAAGTGLMGGNAAGAGQSVLARGDAANKSKLDAFDKGRGDFIQDYGLDRTATKDFYEDDKSKKEMDASSQESQLAQSLAKKMAPSIDFSKMTAQQINEKIPALKSIYEGQIKIMEEHNKAMDRKAMLGLKGSEGQQAVDKDYAKDYNDWTSNGKPSLDKNLQSLEEARDALKTDPSLTGGMTGVMGDRFTADRVLKQRQKVQSAVQNSLKATLGAQFTEKEGERILKNAYNEAASADTNTESLNKTIAQLRASAANNDQKSKYYEQHGSLRGFQAGGSSAPGGDQDKAALDWANKNPNDPRAVKIKQKLGL
jgi:hypothetical protein